VAANSARNIDHGASFLKEIILRKPIMAGNWKMYKTPAETTAFFEKFRLLAGQTGTLRDPICPLSRASPRPSKATQGTNIRIGAQNIAGPRKAPLPARSPPHDRGRRRHPCHRRTQRAAPGISPRLDETVLRRHTGRFGIRPHPHRLRGRAPRGTWKAATAKPCSCASSSRESPVFERQFARIAIAYEPTWAVGTGKTATPGNRG